ncbi:MAG: SH3 domain-containing protein [Spirochaetales bacterium]|nr:SH3 domain-containing protein [Spirochaetales bacterium]
MKKIFFRTAGCLLGAFLVFQAACSRVKPEAFPVITLPPTPAVNLRASWGVVLSSPLRLRQSPSQSAPALASLWQGYVVEIFNRGAQPEEIEGRTGYWYQVNYDGLSGWVFGGYLEIFSSREEARQAVRQP